MEITNVLLSDEIREWRKQHDNGGIICSKYPFQSSICRSYFANDCGTEFNDPFENSIKEMCKFISTQRSSNQNSYNSPASSSRFLDVSALQCRYSSNTASPMRNISRHGSGSICDTIQIVNDVLAFTGDMHSGYKRIEPETGFSDVKVAVKRNQTQTSDQLKQSLPSTVNKISGAISTGTNGTATGKYVQYQSKPTVIPPAPTETKSNPFKSAKTQLIEEGGTIKSSCSTTTAKKVVQSVSGTSHPDQIDSDIPSELAIFEKALIERIEADILHTGSRVLFADIAGLEFAKKCVNELICWPMSRPDLFQGLRSLPRGILLFGPPGTGKTLIGKAIACEVGATFFSISASSLTSKWIGEGEKTVRALFAVAVYRQPSVVFVDEVDSLLCQRSTEENEASRRIKTEFLVQLDGAGTSDASRVVIIVRSYPDIVSLTACLYAAVGATNRPEEIDEAARRRFVKRIYIPLPDEAGRRQLFERLLGQQSTNSDDATNRGKHSLNKHHIETLVEKTAGFSGADIRSLCTEAAMGPIREITMKRQDLLTIKANDVPAISMEHFLDALDAVAPSVSPGDLQRYLDWNAQFGSFRRLS